MTLPEEKNEHSPTLIPKAPRNCRKAGIADSRNCRKAGMADSQNRRQPETHQPKPSYFCRNTSVKIPVSASPTLVGIITSSISPTLKSSVAVETFRQPKWTPSRPQTLSNLIRAMSFQCNLISRFIISLLQWISEGSGRTESTVRDSVSKPPAEDIITPTCHI